MLKKYNELKKGTIVFFLFTIVFVSFFTRIYNISNNPPGFFADEASIGYDAYTLLNSGKDELGNKFPLLFGTFGGSFYRPCVSIYISSFLIFFLGLSEFSLRFSSVIIGTFTVILIYFLAKITFDSDKIGLLSALFLGISPWHIHFSRINQEFIYLVFFITLSYLLLLLGIKKKKTPFFLISFLFFGLSLYTYVTAYFLIPLILIIILFIYKKHLFQMRKELITGLMIFIFLSLPLIAGFTNGSSMSRFNQLSRANSEKSTRQLIAGVVVTYVNHFLPKFLFQKGDIGYPGHFITRFSVRWLGELYWFQLPFILIGLIWAFKKHRDGFFLFFGWLLIYPLGSTLVPFSDGGGPFSMRSIIGVVPFQIFTAAGVLCFFSLIKNKSLKILTGIFLAIIIFSSFGNYLQLYNNEYPLYAADFWGWQYGPKEIVKYFLSVQNSYDDLYMSSEFNAPEIFLKFYDPKNICQNKCKIGDLQQGESIYNSNRRQLFSLSPVSLANSKYKDKFIIKKTIYYPNGQIAFQIGEIIK